MMKSHWAIVLSAVTLFAALAIPTQFIAQEQSGMQLPQNHDTHYKVIDASSLGGPNVTTNSDWSAVHET
jgi:hypothetical protein